MSLQPNSLTAASWASEESIERVLNMATSYDFKDLERETARLEKRLDDFVSKEDSLKTKINNLKWDDRKYSSSSVEKQINNILSEAKNKINRITNSAYDSLKRSYSESLSAISTEAQTANEEIARNNSLVSVINFLNLSYSEGKFMEIINSKQYFDSEANNQQVKKYYLLVKAKSYDAVCNSLKGKVDAEGAEIFADYYSFCKANNAVNHSKNAATLCFDYLSELLKSHRDEIPAEKVYGWARTALACSREVTGLDSEKASFIYETFKEEFNAETKKAFDSFNYSKLKSFVYDSNYLKKDDIWLSILKSQEFNEDDRISFISEKGKLSGGQSLKDVIADNESLLKGDRRNDYLKALLPCFNSENMFSFDSLLSQLKANFGFDALLKLSAMLLDYSDTNLLGEKITSFYCEMILANRKSLPLLDTARLLAKISDSCKVANESVKTKFDDISFTLIKGNLKSLASVDQDLKKKLNELYDSCAATVIGKRPKKGLNDVKRPIPLNENMRIALKKVQGEKIFKNKKSLVILGIVAAVVLIALIIVLALVL